MFQHGCRTIIVGKCEKVFKLNDLTNDRANFHRDIFLEEVRQFRYKDRTSKANAWKMLSGTFCKDGKS